MSFVRRCWLIQYELSKFFGCLLSNNISWKLAPQSWTYAALPAHRAEIAGLDLCQPLGAATVAAIDWAILDWKVIVFRSRHLSNDEQKIRPPFWLTYTSASKS
jgi:hypothetical protein